MCVAVVGEELDISHPVLTDLDTSQIIRSYIGVELAGVDGNLSLSDDTASGLTGSQRDSLELSSWTDDSDDDDDVSLHIRDEACQTVTDGDDCSGSVPRLLGGCFPMLTRGGGGGGDASASNEEDVSVWRTLLYNDDSYIDVDKYVIQRPSQSPSSSSSSESDSVTCPDGKPPTFYHGCRLDSAVKSSRRGFIRSQSCSHLVASVSKPSRTSSVPCVVTTPPEQGIRSDPADRSRRVDACSSLKHGDEMANSALTGQTAMVLTNEQIDQCYSSSLGDKQEPSTTSSVGDESSVATATSLADIALAIQSGDAASMTTGNQTPNPKIPCDDAEGTKSVERSAGASKVHMIGGSECPSGVMCLDHEACGLHMEFVAHL